MTVHYFPLQPSPYRYSGYLDDSIVRRLNLHDVSYIRYQPDVAQVPPAPGSFFEAKVESEFRSRQLAEFAAAMSEGVVEDGDTVFFSDLFMPGAEMVAWLATLEGIELRVRGLVHGGSANEFDVMSRAPWASWVEMAVCQIAEEFYVGSQYMRRAIADNLGQFSAKRAVVTGFLLDENLPVDDALPWGEREDVVVFNGRLSGDKQPELFDVLAERIGARARCVNCIESGLSKAEYYALLGRAKVVVSFALHETFGTAIQEAVAMGCVPVVPDRLCYVEQFAPQYRYESLTEAEERVMLALEGGLSVPKPVDCSGCIERWFDLT